MFLLFLVGGAKLMPSNIYVIALVATLALIFIPSLRIIGVRYARKGSIRTLASPDVLEIHYWTIGSTSYSFISSFLPYTYIIS